MVSQGQKQGKSTGIAAPELQRVEISDRDVLEHVFADCPVRSFARDGEKWFYQNQICRALDIANPRQAFARLETDEKGVSIVDTPGGRQEVNVVNESGMYALIFSSRKPQARAFRHWVTAEVLPALRETGTYTIEVAGGALAFDPKECARYVVITMPGEPPQIRKTSLDRALDEWSGLDTEILANQMRTVDALWQKTQLVRSVGSDPAGSPLYNRLGKAISDARRVADECLDGFRQQSD